MTVELELLPRVSYRGQEIAGARLRGLLALLAGDLRTGCSTARLVAGLWPDEQPENPPKALQILVSRARSQLGPDTIARIPDGYRLTLGEEQVDAAAVALRAAASRRASRTGDHAAALAAAEAGLALWNGPPAEDGAVPDDPVAALRADRAATYRTLRRARALALARLGRCGEAVEPLTEQAWQRPRDEEILLELLRCEAATAGASAALARYEGYRRSLRDQLGTDPGTALRDLQQQLLRAEAPAVRHGVRQEPNPLVGRDDDVAAVRNLLRTSRVTSIVGPGGLGKTRLAHVVSRQAEQRVVQVVALAGVTADADVASEVATVLGAGESRRSPVGHLAPAAPTDRLTGIVEALGPGPALLVLDNCEHVVQGAAELVHALVSTTRELRVLTTSRAPLGLSSESVYLLPELSLPATVELFRQRARAARPEVELPPDVVDELCRRLDGLPLAVELAAARVRAMSVPEIAGRLADRFSLLRGGARDAPRRHHALHAVVDWSWHLLEPAGRAAMRRLSVFPAGFTAGAARHLLDRDDPADVLEQLVDQSLLKLVDTGSGTRFSMLETVREFSTAAREDAGETEPAVDGFLAWAREFGAAHHGTPFGADPYQPLARIRAEQDNLGQALRHGLARSDGGTVAAVAAVLASLWVIESNFPRMATLVADTGWLLSHFRPGPDQVELTRTALTLCTAYTFIVEGPRAVRSLVALRRLPPAAPESLAHAVATVLGGDAPLPELCDSDRPLVAGAANGLASYAAEGDGDLDGALSAARRMLAAYEGQRVPWLWGLAHTRISELCLQVERGAEAVRHLRAALPVAERLGLGVDVVGIRWWMVLANLQRGAVDEAGRLLAQTAPAQADQDTVTFTYGLGVRAEIQLAGGEVEAGLRLWRQAVDRLRAADGSADPGDQTGRWAWTAEAAAVTVIAHAQHGRLELVEDVAGELPHRLATMLARPVGQPFQVESRICGAMLLALAMVDLDRGRRTGDQAARAAGARTVALAERFRFLRTFQPTMSGARAGQAAVQADRSAYQDAVSRYADLSRSELRAAALAVLPVRDQT